MTECQKKYVFCLTLFSVLLCLTFTSLVLCMIAEFTIGIVITSVLLMNNIGLIVYFLCSSYKKERMYLKVHNNRGGSDEGH